MTTWADVWLSLSGAPVGALIAVGGIHLTNKANLSAKRIEAQAQAAMGSTMRRLDRRDTLYTEIIELAGPMDLSLRAHGHDSTLEHEAVAQLRKFDLPTQLHGSKEVNWALIDYADACTEELMARVGEDIKARERVRKRMLAAYQVLIKAIRKDLGHTD